jgi:hypothetical protein
MLRRENHRHRQKIAEQVSSIRDLSNQINGPPGSGGSRASLMSQGSMQGSSRGGSRVLDNLQRSNVTRQSSRPTTSASIDPRNMLATRGNMSSQQNMIKEEESEWDDMDMNNVNNVNNGNNVNGGGSTTSLPRPESTTNTSRRQNLSTAGPRGSTAKPIKSRNVSTASLGGSSEHLRTSSRSRIIPGKVIRGSTRPIMEAATKRSKVQGMLNELDVNNRLIEMQRIEIGRLREQVQLLVEQGQHPAQTYPNNDTYHLVPEDGVGISGGDMPPAFVMSQSQSQPNFSQGGSQHLG